MNLPEPTGDTLRSDKFAETIALAVSRSSVEPFSNVGMTRASDSPAALPSVEERPIVHIYTTVLNPPEKPLAGPLIIDPVLANEPPMKFKPSESALPAAKTAPAPALAPTQADLRASETSLLQASLQLLESQVVELDQVIKRLEAENDRLRRENQSLVRLIAKVDDRPRPRGGFFDWMRGFLRPLETHR